jgi:hypothetical protein
VRKFRVRVEGGFVGPLGMDKKEGWITRRFVELDSNAARFCAGRGEKRRQFVKQMLLFSRYWFKPDKYMKRHKSPQFA